MKTMSSFYNLVLATLFVSTILLLLVESSTASSTNNGDEKIHNDLIEWIRSKGGEVSNKIQIQRHPMGYMGVFAIEDIHPQELLFRVPKDCYIHVTDQDAESMSGGETIDDELEAYNHNLCKLAHLLMDEMELGTKSDYAPFIAYLKTQRKGQLPVNWSKSGKDMLREVAFPGSPIVDWIDWNFKETKCIEEDDKFAEHMVEMTVQRCFDTALIPLWDMVNHDNGQINTENDSIHDVEGVKLRAAQPIKAGEEIFASYDKCLDCLGIDNIWGTPEILKDFGFVERYPHRWVWFDEPHIWFEIVEKQKKNDDDDDDDDDDDESSLQVNFYQSAEHDDGEVEEDYDYYEYGIPDTNQIQFLQMEVNRLIDVGKKYLLDQGDVPDYEWQTINEFHKSAITDISLAIQEATRIRSLDSSQAQNQSEL